MYHDAKSIQIDRLIPKGWFFELEDNSLLNCCLGAPNPTLIVRLETHTHKKTKLRFPKSTFCLIVKVTVRRLFQTD